MCGHVLHPMSSCSGFFGIFASRAQDEVREVLIGPFCRGLLDERVLDASPHGEERAGQHGVSRATETERIGMGTLRCPGMDPANFKLDDIKLGQCLKCGGEIEFWKDDVRVTCDSCGHKNFNPDIGSTCLAWCEKAVACVGSSDILEWKKRTGGGYSSRAACEEHGGVRDPTGGASGRREGSDP